MIFLQIKKVPRGHDPRTLNARLEEVPIPREQDICPACPRGAQNRHVMGIANRFFVNFRFHRGQYDLDRRADCGQEGIECGHPLGNLRLNTLISSSIT